ncbi:MAG: RtcB family protein [Planctomycetota bacterium]
MGNYDVEPHRVNDYCWEVAPFGGMNVPARVYASDELMGDIMSDDALDQAINVAHLPGIVDASYAMPDMHWGYGFPIGGVAAFDADKDGVISPGGIGYDINCGVRMVRSDLELDRVKDKIDQIVSRFYSQVPCGVGSSGGIKEVSQKDFRRVMVDGAEWAVKKGMGTEEDLNRTEEGGAMYGAIPETVSKKAVKRGRSQLGTLGSGNHFLEVDYVDHVFDQRTARVFGVHKNAVIFQIHCGSRGFGHQICTDYIEVMRRALNKYGINPPDKQLCCAPIESDEGRNYFAAMAAGANFAWCNRQIIFSNMVEVLEKLFKTSRRSMGIEQVYDVCHNIAKFERHSVDGKKRELCDHRKGATRAFPPGHADVPGIYRDVGQPVLIPGSMGTCSYLLAGTQKGMEATWGSTCHGAGRTMSRRGAKKKSEGRNLLKEMSERGVTVKARGMGTVAEEMPHAYKNVESVVDVMHEAGLTRRVARVKPIAVIKG